MKSFVFVAVLSSLAFSSPALAEIIDELPTSNHDSGFMFRGTLGLGYESLSRSDGDLDFSLGGLGASISIALGGFVIPNLAINADLYATTVINPTATLNGQEFGDLKATLGLGALGVGVTYYIMPVNLYLAASVGFGRATLEVDGDTSKAEIGFSLHALIGKEFFVSTDWGLGVAAEMIFADVPVDDGASSGSFLGFNVAFTITYN